MAFDGSVIYALTKELNDNLTSEKALSDSFAGGRISKIIQPEKEELIITIKNNGIQYKLLISVNPSLPIVYLTDESKPAPITAPAFCMLLRKHLQGGRILGIQQPSMERIINFRIEHRNEMGDLCEKILTVELMGKHSNIILREGSRILDSIKHVSALVSSVREVLPGREYFVPFEGEKADPLNISESGFYKALFEADCTAQGMEGKKAFYTAFTGFSPSLAEEVFCRADGIDSGRAVGSYTEEEKKKIYEGFLSVMKDIKSSDNCFNIIYEGDEPVFYGTFAYRSYDDQRYCLKRCASPSQMLWSYYNEKQIMTATKQKTADLRQTVLSLLNKNYKKYDLQLRQIKDTEKKDKFKVYGELLTAYGYNAEPGASSMQAENFYTGEMTDIPLDPALTAVQNGKKYFEKYSKLKRTYAALSEIIVQTRQETEHLESILMSLDIVKDQADVVEIRREMAESGYIKSSQPAKKTDKMLRSEPMHFISSDGFHIYVGKNNFQNDQLSFKMAKADDWWFHAKDMPGSHCIVRCSGHELSDKSCEEASRLAAHFSKGASSDKIEVQYTQCRNLKKPQGAKPGFVTFNTFYSLQADTDISGICRV